MIVDVESFYDAFAENEWRRLEKHRTEFAVTLMALDTYLPKRSLNIIDIGSGPGRYAIELSKRGHAVTLVDLSKENLKIAREKADAENVTLSAYFHANVLQLENSINQKFDAVLLMGPLYHLLKHEERMAAVLAAKSCLKSDGIFFASFITIFAPFRKAAVDETEWLHQEAIYARRLLETGIHDRAEKFGDAFFIHPKNVIPLMESCGLQTQRLMSIEGIVAGHEESVNQLRGPEWQAWVELNYRLGQDESLHGAADHLLFIGKPI